MTGYGNTMPDYVRAMSLTTVDQPFAEVGAMAAKLLLERTAGASAERTRRPRDVTVPVSLVVRQSSTHPIT